MKQLTAILLSLSSASCTLLFDTSPTATLDGGGARDGGVEETDSGVTYCESTPTSPSATLLGVQALDTNCDGSDEIFAFVDVNGAPEVWIRDSTCPLRANWDAQRRWLPTVIDGATTARLAVQRLALLDESEICSEAELIAIGPGVTSVTKPSDEAWIGFFGTDDRQPVANARQQRGMRQLNTSQMCGLPAGPMHLVAGDFDSGEDPRPDLTFTSSPGAVWRYLRSDVEPVFDVSCQSSEEGAIPISLSTSDTALGATFGLLRLEGALLYDEVLEVGEQGLIYRGDTATSSAFSSWQAITTASGAAVARGPLVDAPVQLAAVAWNEDLRLTAQYISYSEVSAAAQLTFLTVTHQLEEPSTSGIIAGAIIRHESVPRVALLLENKLVLVHLPSDPLADVQVVRVPLAGFAVPPSTIVTVRPGPGANEQLFVFSDTAEFQCFEIQSAPVGLVPCS